MQGQKWCAKNAVINYRKKVFKCTTFSDYIFELLASRFGVPVPIVVMTAIGRSQFKHPQTILLSTALLQASLILFIQECIHEFAHYIQWMKTPKKRAALRRGQKAHGVEFYNWLIACCRAFFGKDWDGMEYAWEGDYPLIQKRARRDGWYKEKGDDSEQTL